MFISKLFQLFSALLNMSEGSYQLSWEAEERATTLLGDYRTLLTSGEFHDVTLLTEDDQLIRAHRVILAACSPFFRNIFSKTDVTNLHLEANSDQGARHCARCR